MRQRRFDFRPAARLQAAVGIDLKFLRIDDLGGLRQQHPHLGGTGDARGVNVPHARTDLVGVLEFDEGAQQLHVRTRGFDGYDVSVKSGDRRHDVVELGIAHMRVICAV